MDNQLAAARIVQECYSTGYFDKLISIITDDYEHHSFWVMEPMRGKETVIPYYTGKGKAIRESGGLLKSMIVRISDHPAAVRVNSMNINGETFQNARVFVQGSGGKACVLIEQEVENGELVRVLAIPTVNKEGMITELLITEPALFNLIPLEE